MHLLIGTLLALAALTLWCRGYWIGRVIAFIVVFLAGAAISQMWAVAHQVSPMLGHILAFIAALAISAAPAYWRRFSSGGNRRF